MQGPLTMPAEVTWARQMLERSEREYSTMVDELMRENQQLESLARLLSEQLKELACGQQANGQNQFVGTLVRIEEALKYMPTARSERSEVLELQKKLRKEEVESQSLRRQLEEVLKDRMEQLGMVAISMEAQPKDVFLSCEARRGELAEARCALVEARYQQTVQRLETEVRAARRELDSVSERAQGSGEAGALPSSSSLSPSRPCSPEFDSQALHEQVLTLRAQLKSARELHQRHLSMYQRYLPDLATNIGRSPLPAGLDALPANLPAEANLFEFDQEGDESRNSLSPNRPRTTADPATPQPQPLMPSPEAARPQLQPRDAASAGMYTEREAYSDASTSAVAAKQAKRRRCRR